MLLTWLRGIAMEYHFRYYTDADGLSSNTVQCIYQDTKGYIWIGTADGLIRFNSNDFTCFRSDYDNEHMLGNDCVYALCSESYRGSERIWVGTSNGISVFDTADESFSHIDLMPGSDAGEYHNMLVWTMVPDAYNGIWIGTIGAGLFRYDLSDGSCRHFDPEVLGSDVVRALLADKDRNIWVGTDRYILRYNSENNTFSKFEVRDTRQHLSISGISSMSQDSFGNIWIAGFDSELFKFEVPQLIFTANIPEGKRFGRIRNLTDYTPGTMLLGTDHGLVSFSLEDRTFRLIDDGTSDSNGRLNDKFVHSILKDREGGIWIGTYFGGINYMSPFSRLFSVLESDPASGRVISKFCEDAQGNIWIGSDDGGLSLYNPRTESYRRVYINPTPLELNIHALLMDGSTLWVGTYGNGLFRVDLRTYQSQHLTEREMQLDNLDVYSLYRDSHGMLWIGTKRSICCYDDETNTIRHLHELGYNSDVVDICEDIDGGIWFATLGNGIIRYSHETDSFTAFNKSDRGGAVPDFIGCLTVSGPNIWIGTHGRGLYKYDLHSDTLTSVFEGTLYANSSIFQIIQNGDELWLTSNYGLLQYRYNSPESPIYIYTSEDGLLANIFNANSGFKALSGHIYLGCNKGVNKFYPYDFVNMDHAPEPNVVFNSMRILGQNSSDNDAVTGSIDHARTVRISGRKVSFSLDFTALNYASPTRTVYRYKLENFDQGWTTTALNENTGLQRVSYSNLAANHYRFVVSASSNGVRFGEEAYIDIYISAPWWATSGMQFLYALLLILLTGAFIYRWRRRVLAKYRRELTDAAARDNLNALHAHLDRLNGSISDLRPPLNLISALTAQLSEELSGRNDLQADLEQLRSSSLRLNSIVDQMLNDTVPAIVADPAGGASADPTAVDGGSAESDAAADSGRAALPGGQEPPRGPENGARNILFVDGDSEYARFAVRYLSQDYTIHYVADGRSALNFLRLNRVAVVVSAVNLPDMDGTALCTALRADESTEDLPVILLSSDSSSEMKGRVLNTGADVFLEKSVPVSYLGTQIRALADSRDSLRFKYSRLPYMQSGSESDTQQANGFMNKVNQYIEENLSNSEITVDDIADAVKVSRTLLFTRIKQLTGSTPNEFLRLKRLKAAAELLAGQNDLRVSEICYMTGFSSTSYFAKCFRKQFGMLPNQYMVHFRHTNERPEGGS